MDVNKAISVVSAVKLLAETFGENPQEFGSTLCVFWEHRLPILNDAIKTNNQFVNSDIIKRGEMLGIKIHRSDGGGYETEEIVLSEE